MRDICKNRDCPFWDNRQHDCNIAMVVNALADSIVPKPLATLTGREHEVLVLLCRGYSNQDMAAALFLTKQTIKNHVSNVLGKLGVRSRAEAIAKTLGNNGNSSPKVDVGFYENLKKEVTR